MGSNSLNNIKQGIFVYEDLDGKLVIGMSNNLIDRKDIAYKLLTEALDVVTLDLLQDQLKDSTNLH
jgi:hypothetical protein